MFKRTFYIVIILPLLIQHISCLPRSPSFDSVDSSLPGTITIDENAVPSDDNSFEEALRKGYVNYTNFALQRTNQIAKDVLADPSMYIIDSEAMQKELSLLRKYVTDSNEALNKVLPADQFVWSTELMFAVDKDIVTIGFKRFRNFEFEPHTPEQQVIWEALKKHGLLEYEKEENKRDDEYLRNLVDEFEKYVKTLSAAEKEKNKCMKAMMAAWNAYKKNEISKRNFGKTLHENNFEHKFVEWIGRLRNIVLAKKNVLIKK